MTILSDKEIIELCDISKEGVENPMIYPFHCESVKRVGDRKVLSFGVSSFGYDVRLANKFKIFSNVNATIIDPKKFDTDCLIDAELKKDEDGSEYVILPPNSYLLGYTMETFDIPRDIMVVAVGKSTMARSGVQVNVTPIEAGFKGTVVIEIANSTSLPVKIYAEEGISQFLFFKGNQDCKVSYGDRNGKYQHQHGLTMSKV